MTIRYYVCHWCNHWERAGTPEQNKRAIIAHLAACDKHPMAALRAEIETLRRERDRLKEALDEIAHGNDQFGAMYGPGCDGACKTAARRALAKDDK